MSWKTQLVLSEKLGVHMFIDVLIYHYLVRTLAFNIILGDSLDYPLYRDSSVDGGKDPLL